MSHLALARDQIQFARDYSTQLLADIAEQDWFTFPDGLATHVAWQVGHLAMAEYGLTLLRIRGKQPEDADFITNDFMRCFKKGSTPVADATQYPTVAEIRKTFDAVHQHAMEAMLGYRESDLSEALPAPTAVFGTKLGSLLFCSAHEMMHAGQIGLLRRSLGMSPLR